jgi:hypothetical protein
MSQRITRLNVESVFRNFLAAVDLAGFDVTGWTLECGTSTYKSLTACTSSGTDRAVTVLTRWLPRSGILPLRLTAGCPHRSLLCERLTGCRVVR